MELLIDKDFIAPLRLRQIQYASQIGSLELEVGLIKQDIESEDSNSSLKRELETILKRQDYIGTQLHKISVILTYLCQKYGLKHEEQNFFHVKFSVPRPFHMLTNQHVKDKISEAQQSYMTWATNSL